MCVSTVKLTAVAYKRMKTNGLRVLFCQLMKRAPAAQCMLVTAADSSLRLKAEARSG